MDKVLPTVWRYRLELLPLLAALAVGNHWRLYPLVGLVPTDPKFMRAFVLLSNIPAVLVVGAGLIWALWRDQSVVAGLWAIVFVRPLVVILFNLALAFEWAWITPSPNSLTLGLLWNVAFQVAFVLPVAFFAWRLGSLGPRHAMLIAAGYLAWVHVPLVEPWNRPFFFGTFETTLAVIGLALWIGMLAGLAYAFHHFPEWHSNRQRLAVLGLAVVPLVAGVLAGLPFLIRDLRRGRLDLLTWPPDQIYFLSLVVPLIAGGLLLTLTWLLTRRWAAQTEAPIHAE